MDTYEAEEGDSGGLDEDVVDGEKVQPSYCTSVGTWADVVHQGFAAWPELFPNGTIVKVTSVNGCSFDIAKYDITRTVQCDALSSVPVTIGAEYEYESCETPQSFDMRHATIVMRDRDGAIVVAGGTGNEIIDSATCIPSELKVSKVMGECEPFQPPQYRCGEHKNFGIRFEHGEQDVVLYPGQSATMTIGAAMYTIYNFYSFNAVSWDIRCTDTFNEYSSWAMVRVI